MRGLIALGTGLMLAGCSVVGIRSGTEEPKYTIVQSSGPVEIRRYDARIAIQTRVSGSEFEARAQGFRRLADYIFGNNRGRAKIAMTAPVAQASEKIDMTASVGLARDGSGSWVIRFYAPSSYTVDTMPAPNNPLVSIVAVPPETVAVIRFSGFGLAGAVAERQAELLDKLKATDWHAKGQPFAWLYDPPWTIPFLRRNEVGIVVMRAGA